jgi:HK97 family phage major capsid protein
MENKETKTEGTQTPEVPVTPTTVERSATQVNEAPQGLSSEDMGEMFDLAAKHNCRDKATEIIRAGGGVNELARWIVANKQDSPAVTNPETHVDLSPKEEREYSIVRAAQAYANKRPDAAPFESEVSDEIAKQVGRQARGFFVPYTVLRVEASAGNTIGGNGENLRPDEHRADLFIDLLRNKQVLNQLGITRLSGLVGTVSIPRQTGAATASWVAEGGSGSQTEQDWDTVSLALKTVQARSPMTRQMMAQALPPIENLVRNDIAGQLARAVDSAGLQGGGANEPSGVANEVAPFTTLGVDGDALDWDDVVALETNALENNAELGNPGYVTNYKVRGKLKTTKKDAGSGIFLIENGELNGYGVTATNAIASNLTQGSGTSLSRIIFGSDWADLLMGEWGVLDIIADPFTNVNSGGLVIHGFYDVDFAVRHTESFAQYDDVVTT